ncbi:MAG: precorrin-3B C(17)-methyltransferase [Nitrospiraceae bacterium]
MIEHTRWTQWHHTAVVALTRCGYQHSLRLLAKAPGACVYVPAGMNPGDQFPTVQTYDQGLADLLPRLFRERQALVVFAALGAVVRILAPVLGDKRSDPAVIVVDEEARHVISVLSGHRGGANVLTRTVAEALHAVPVITTASDTQGLPSLDLLGRQFGWRLEDESGLTGAMAALVNGDPLLICQEAGERDWWESSLPDHVLVVYSLQNIDVDAYAAIVLITDRVLSPHLLEGVQGSSRPPLMLYRPRTLSVGIGCERGVTMETIDEAVRGSLVHFGLSFSSLLAIGSIDVKRDEPGLLACAARYDLPIHWYSSETLRAVGGPTSSEIVARYVGTPGVAEPAARLASGGGALVGSKMKHGRVTVAVARKDFCPMHSGRILLVGVGPGDRADMTPRAVDALRQADVVLGYRRYLEPLQDLLMSKRVIPGELTKERERAEQTVELAVEGNIVALVSSGDSGIYGMAGLVFEILAERAWDSREGVQVEVVPGITALSACAALLGAPVMHDFAAISLSDLLTPWSTIKQRLQAAAQADFVLGVYNPKSSRRATQFEEACSLLLRYRSGDTLVGVVHRAGRPGSQTTITTLACLPECEVDMETLVLIGNTTTKLVGDRMVTPRGYPAAPAVLAVADPKTAENQERS